MTKTRDEWRALVAEFEASGLSRVEFCRQAGVGVSALDKWRYRFQYLPPPSSPALVPIVVVDTQVSVTLTFGTRRVELMGRAHDLAQILRAL